ncbi:UrcA family protein [Sphingopyxis sp.]|uniref:UrcA family protein n=1 Tax=Sphingopyxis sp. TaxID=1908224 RepID=UPI002EDB103E
MAKFPFILFAAPLAAAGTVAPATASAAGEERQSVTVRYDDLNLSSERDRDRLTTRIKLAVETVCGGGPGYRQALRERAIAQRCEATTMADANVKLASLFGGDGTRLAARGRIVVAAP